MPDVESASAASRENRKLLREAEEAERARVEMLEEQYKAKLRTLKERRPHGRQSKARI